MAAANSAAALPRGRRITTARRYGGIASAGVGSSMTDKTCPAGRRPAALRELELGQRVATSDQRLGAQQEHEAITGLDGLPYADVVSFALGQLRPVEEHLVAFLAQGE